eukprot:CAMPEP_0176079482 /NCGR_PEP_ID=MMETSP0120_2-20121206/39754_1 /TAXON_ID=160619 /ORGANISM="Kryptoperidinium foliaceum, Strain CCMP 1326" /LENGTH=48 /DNA_ID= /DNA_START= /DNA_END= /DNA_ORIENTATION=
MRVRGGRHKVRPGLDQCMQGATRGSGWRGQATGTRAQAHQACLHLNSS